MDPTEKKTKPRKLSASQFYASFNISDESSHFYIGDVNATAPSEIPPTVYTLKRLEFMKENLFKRKDLGNYPINFFDFFFSSDLLTSICEYTNNNAKLILQDPTLSKTSLLRTWTNLTVDELKIFLGLLFHMGTIKMDEFRDYWRLHRLFQLPIFMEQMERNRFIIILRFLKFTAIEVEDSYSEIRSLIDYFNETMTFYYPGRELVFTDNVLIRNRRVVFNHQNKINKDGYKFFMLTEPNGLVLKLHVHTGGEDTKPGISNSILHEIMKEYLNNGHALYTNVCYQGYVIAKHFLNMQTYYTGVMERLPEKYKENALKTLRVGESTTIFRDSVHIGTWRGDQPISYITTEYSNSMMSRCSKSGQEEQKPEVVVIFNEVMNTRARQKDMMQFYPCRQKPMRTYLKAAIHIFHLMLMNSHKIYNQCSSRPKKSFQAYRLAVIDALLPIKKRTKARKPMPATWEGHMLEKFEKQDGRGQTKRRSCLQCKKSRFKRRDTAWYCKGCKGKPAFCVECFNDYHAQHQITNLRV